MAPVLVVWAPEVPPGPPLVIPQSVVLSTLACIKLGWTKPLIVILQLVALGGGVMEKNTCDLTTTIVL